MALSGTVLTTAIKGKITSKNPDFAPNIGADLDWLIESIAEAVVEHIVASAQVVVVSVSGVTAGAAASGPGTGTIT